MSVRYYLSALLPPGTVTVGSRVGPRAVTRDHYRSAVADAWPKPKAVHVAHTPLGPDGVPTVSALLLVVEADDWSGIDADPRNVRLSPAVLGEASSRTALLTLLDGLQWSGVPGAIQTAILAALQRLGMASGDVSASMSFRSIVRRAHAVLRPGATELGTGIG